MPEAESGAVAATSAVLTLVPGLSGLTSATCEVAQLLTMRVLNIGPGAHRSACRLDRVAARALRARWQWHIGGTLHNKTTGEAAMQAWLAGC